jgi:excisionase family DNA binding protein
MARKPQSSAEGLTESPSSRISVPEIARRLNIGRLAVYSMLEQGIIPGVRLGRRWIITRHAYLAWERTCGLRAATGLRRQPEVVVVN